MNKTLVRGQKSLNYQEIQSLLQKEIETNFNKFIEMDIDGHKIFIMPIKDEIPSVGNITYDKSTDILEIRLSSAKDTHLSEKSEEINFYFVCLFDSYNELIGFKIRNFTKLLKINDRISEDLKMKNIKECNPADIMRLDLNKRKLISFRNFVKNDINAIVSNP
jgi:hypothetical protein